MAQLIVEAIITPEPVWVDSLDETARGTGGFGSTGG
jgi:dUTP pyrophosphatase